MDVAAERRKQIEGAIAALGSQRCGMDQPTKGSRMAESVVEQALRPGASTVKNPEFDRVDRVIHSRSH
jgi:hypothetical protein